ncbi:MAG TPA: thiosulfate oxidation carrier protein SoxY [Thiolapillus brandeum]|uniref:Thiosulfate oxidation carrier protein SoxY n=1 Tax=Thiolapillus brandeum TaxID=1076588 RepID=A0A831NVW3_9GAMM|nr:thiosulfate oxidation carrier protein SoxY [Thiolapillus brandeum]
MSLNQKRRVFLKGSLAAGTLGAAAGLLTPGMVLAAWNKTAFTAKGIDEAIAAAAGSPTTAPSTDITIKAPDIAENGAVVPVSVSTKIDGVESISMLVEKNSTPLSAVFHLPKGTLPDVSTRVKMGKTGDVIAVVKANGKLYSARKSVKVTIGGCGG